MATATFSTTSTSIEIIRDIYTLHAFFLLNPQSAFANSTDSSFSLGVKTTKVSRNTSEMSMESLRSPDSVKSFASSIARSPVYSSLDRGSDSVFSSRGEAF